MARSWPFDLEDERRRYRAIAVYLTDLPAGKSDPVVTQPPQAEMAAVKALDAHAASPAMKPMAAAPPASIPPLPEATRQFCSRRTLQHPAYILDGCADRDGCRARPIPDRCRLTPRQLSDQEIASVCRHKYIRKSGGNAGRW